ncbi:MAG: bifunctional metallophosphatase/5'-nucleotidase [Clostridia bacterium]|nr:bifunctional metallophosphatase/5'-nucleotidase [Clostridia bacterium]MBQ5487304.1 bifunctional metallophosphatase/5'-nucleotidase [Clostridia bacterium]
MKTLKKLTLLHSNDMHGDFFAEEVDQNLIGGVSLLSGYLNKVRAEEPNTIYCVAGDMFRGSVIDSEFLGISTIEIMNMLSPDVVCIGNHETDYGLAHLLFLEKCARFPIVNANMHIKTNNARLFRPFIVLHIGGMKILFIGVLTEEVLAQTRNDGLVGTIVNVEEAAREVTKICNAYHAIDIDFTVLLTHIGFEEDKKLAAMLDPSLGVDVIIGGHSHTVIDEPAKVNDILIVQAGTGTDQIGRFDIMIDTEANCLDSYEWQCIPISSDTCPRDVKLEELLARYKSSTDSKYGRVVTRFNRCLTHPTRYAETELGDVFADAFSESLGVDLFLLGSGSIRSKEMGPIVLYQDMMEAFPYDDEAYLVMVQGKQLRHMVAHVLRDEAFADGAHTEFYQFSNGTRIIYARERHEFLQFNICGKPLEDDRLYSVGLQAYHFHNMEDSFGLTIEELSRNRKPRVIATSCCEILDEYLSSHQHLDCKVGDRLIVL